MITFVETKKGIKYKVIFDKEDLNIFMLFNWSVLSSGKKKYLYKGVCKKGEKTKTVLLHRLIMNAPKGMEVDHINGNGLDNRKSNLRLCDKSQNGINRGPNKNGKLKGITKINNRWMARVNYYNKNIYIGLFKTPIDAAKAYNKKAKELFGEFAYMNNI